MSDQQFIGVIGAGTMGLGIAQAFACIDCNVTVIEADASRHAHARDQLETSLRRAGELGKLKEEPEDVILRVRLASDVTDIPGDTSLVIEAVPEVAAVKVEVLAAVQAVVSDESVLASNTSSLSITELGAVLEHPQRFLGMHFFNPVPGSKLVELVISEATSDDVVTKATDWAGLLGKQPIVVRDSPGFATSRLGVLLGLEAIRMLEEGVASAASIDEAMELGYRHSMGPLRSTDLVGLDVRMTIAEHLHATLGERFSVPTLLREKVARGEYGKKTGQGFFAWE